MNNIDVSKSFVIRSGSLANFVSALNRVGLTVTKGEVVNSKIGLIAITAIPVSIVKDR